MCIRLESCKSGGCKTSAADGWTAGTGESMSSSHAEPRQPQQSREPNTDKNNRSFNLKF